MDWEQRCRELLQRIEELECENRELRRIMGYPEPVRSAVAACCISLCWEKNSISQRDMMHNGIKSRDILKAVWYDAVSKEGISWRT